MSILSFFRVLKRLILVYLQKFYFCFVVIFVIITIKVKNPYISCNDYNFSFFEIVLFGQFTRLFDYFFLRFFKGKQNIL